jgi:proteasome lid subunit RPN8/RPN11
MSRRSVSHPILTGEALEAIYAHARRDYPNECCGIVYGPRSQRAANRAICCKNIQNRMHADDPARYLRDARRAYSFGKGDIAALQKSLGGDTPAKIIYHSHVDVGAYFSVADQEGALFDGEPAYPVEYVVVDIRTDKTCTAKQFAWNVKQRIYIEVRAYT